MLLAEVPSGHCAVEASVLSLPDKSLQSAHVFSREAIPETLLPDPKTSQQQDFAATYNPIFYGL